MKEEKLKTYKKFINFYKLYILPSFKDASKDDTLLLYEVFNSVFLKSNSVKTDSIQYDKISLDKNHFFGCIHRISSIDIFTDIKSKSDVSFESEDMFLESCTFFYIDFNKLGISAIKTQRIQNPAEFIKIFIEKYSSLNIEIAPFKKDEKEIKQLMINQITLTFCNDDFVELKDIDKTDCEFGEYTISAKLTKVSKHFLPQIIKKFKNNSSLKKLYVSTDTEDIDLIKNIFTKQVSIELTKNYKNDFDKIEEILKLELLKIVNT